MTTKVAVSACLLGVACRYDGASKRNEDVVAFLHSHDCDVVRICPEVMGGLAIPHDPHEIDSSSDSLKVIDSAGSDHTEAFVAGARACCEKVQQHRCTCAILKSKSPSCGVGQIYDGTFSGVLVEGDGVAARMLKEEGLTLADEHTFLEVFDREFVEKEDFKKE